MSEHKLHTIIIGAGLTGLTAAYELKKSGVNALLLEARPRIGGRIHTKYHETLPPFELGATWIGMKHQSINSLLKELDIEIFEQYLGDTAIYEPISTSPPQVASLPKNPVPSYRIAGGTSSVIQGLVDQLDPDQIKTGAPIQAVDFQGKSIVVTTIDQSFEGEFLISTLPPKLLVDTIDFKVPLPKNIISLARHTHTWMGESIKVGFTFSRPFWLESGTSGTIFSNVGPVGEMYDHRNIEQDRYAIKGFMNSAFHAVSEIERRDRILTQLRKYYGEKVNDYLTYEDCVWRNEAYTFSPYETHIIPHQNNGHDLFRTPQYEGRFFIAGSETATQYPGYMDGAVWSGRYAAEQVLKQWKSLP